MKWMKWILVLAMGAAMCLGTVGCGGSDDDDPLVGTWRATEFNGQALPATISMTVTFNDNGTFAATSTINGEVENDSGTWSTDGSTLTIVDEEETTTSGYTVEGDTLTITDEEGSFTLVRD